jgi:hypothetical protein
MTDTTQMRQGSTHQIQLNAVAPLTVERVTAMTLKLFKAGSKTAFMTKTLNNGIEPADNTWMITINGSELTTHGQIERQLEYISDSKNYVVDLGFSDIAQTK